MNAIPQTVWDGPAPPTQPGTSPGTKCAEMISGGVNSYQCALGSGHNLTVGECGQPEPHYVIDVSRSVHQWRDWAADEWAARRAPAAPPQGYVATARGNPDVSLPPAESIPCSAGLAGCVINGPHTHGTDPIPGSDQDKMDRLAQATRVGPVRVKPESGEGLSERVTPETGPASDRVVVESRALRQRPGDQVIPDGDESLVDDQSLLVDDINARRQVGIERYGQGHRPFNGRHTLRDLYEENLDALVYMRSLVRMSEATREDLVDLVTQVFTGGSIQGLVSQALAEAAVDRIRGWVDAQIIGVKPLPPEVMEEIIQQAIEEGVATEATFGEIANRAANLIDEERRS